MFKAFVIACLASAAIAASDNLTSALAQSSSTASQNKKMKHGTNEDAKEHKKCDKNLDHKKKHAKENAADDSEEEAEESLEGIIMQRITNLAQVSTKEFEVDPREAKENEFLLAQTESSGHTCKTTAIRNKAQVDDFWSTLQNTAAKYTDSDFTADESALAWTDMGETHNWTGSEFKRAQTNFPNATLFGAGISTDDINQGAIGNCWFQAAASGLAEKSGRMEKVFMNTDNALNTAGIYGVTFYALGVPHTVVVDDYLPTHPHNSSRTLLGHAGDDGSLWGAILEKAFAKYWGNYKHTEAGWPTDAIRTLHGAPWEDRWSSNTSVDDLWDFIVKHDNSDDIITTGTNGNNHFINNEVGLAGGHAYTVIGAQKLSNGARLLKLRNPWGVENYTGPYCDTDSRWTAALKAEVNLVSDKRDGFFWIPVEDFAKMTSGTSVNYDTTGWSMDYFLMLDDDMSLHEGGNRYCKGANCSKHTLEIISEVDQTIYVTAHTWDARMAPKSCTAAGIKREEYHCTYSNKLRIPYNLFGYASNQSVPYEAKAGEKIDYTAEWNWKRENLSRDWSVVAWGNAGKVTVKHTNAGAVTAHMPVAPANGSTPAPAPAPTPAPTPTPTPEPVVPDFELIKKTDAQKKFDQDVAEFMPRRSHNGCKWGYREQRSCATQSYNSIMKVECEKDDMYIDFRILMVTHEWEELEYEWFMQNPTNGNIEQSFADTVQECNEKWNYYTECTFRLSNENDTAAYMGAKGWGRLQLSLQSGTF